MAASYISVPRDLTKVKSKVMFNLTKRQLICFGMAALIGVPSFFLLKTVVKVNTAVMGMMAIMMPFFFLAMYEKILAGATVADLRRAADAEKAKSLKDII